MKTIKALKYVGFGILGVGAMFLFVWLVMLLWNSLVPELFNGPVLTYWQSAGMLILSKILLSGLGSRGSKSRSYSKSKWQSKYHDKYSKRCAENDVKVEDIDPEVQPG